MSRIEFISMFQLALKLLSQHHFLRKIFFQVQWMTIRDYVSAICQNHLEVQTC